MLIQRLWEVFVLGLRNLLRNKLRSFLTMLGIIFGVGSVIAMLAVGAGARAEILARIQELGINNIIVKSTKPPEEKKATSQTEYMNTYGLTFNDADQIEETCSTVKRILRVNHVKERIWFGSKRLEASVLGVSPIHLDSLNLKVRRGRLFNEVDSRTKQKVCIIRKGLISELETIEDVLGLTLRIGKYPFKVIGVLEEEDFRTHTREVLSLDDRSSELYIPYETSMKTFGTISFIERSGSREFTKVELDQLIVQTRAAELVFPTAQMIASILQNFHDQKDYEIVVPLELLQQSEKTQQVFNIVMVLIAGISLLVGGIGIVNIMLATITERTKEIGIRRALGAQQRDIVVQFLMETVAISLIGGLIGCALGIGGIFVITHFTSWQAIISPHYVGISLGISCTVGVVFGIFPARRAALMDPITALRYE